MIKRSWVEINLKTVLDNFNIYKSQISSGQEIMAVVKADAYGHGDVEIARLLSQNGVKHFAVSNIYEAVKLRKADIKEDILILGYTPAADYKTLLEYDITQALLSEEYAEKLAGKGIKAQFAIDTGMNRIGLDADDKENCVRIIRKYAELYKLTGIFTHLCVADNSDENAFTEKQINSFKNIADSVEDLRLPYIHCMNSAGGLRKEQYGNLVRLGIILYGLKPDYSNVIPDGIKPALEWKSVVSMVKTVHRGETVGYGRTFKAEKEMLVATIPNGYADGYSRMLSNRGYVLIHGRKAPVLGKICMDQMMVDVTGIDDVKFEDEVTLIGENFTADDMAHLIDTIGYEVICDISKRVPRVYIK